MPERELWPVGPGAEPVTRNGSCDSMMSTASTHSGSQSDSSYDFLSAEEKECLLFLEETIGSLDTEADSGLSTDESEPATTPQASRTLPPPVPASQACPEKTVPPQTPEPRRESQSNSPQTSEQQGLSLRSGSYSLPRNIHIGRNQQPRKSTSEANRHSPGDSERLVPEPESRGTSRSSRPILAPTTLQEADPDLDAVLIPPPEAFRDPRPGLRGDSSLPKQPGQPSSTAQLYTTFGSQKRQQPSSEAMSQKANEKVSASGPGQSRPPLAASSQNAGGEDAPLPSGGDSNARMGPLTAPKPRKLPPNIVLKSSRSSFHSDPHNWLSRHSEAAPADSGLVSSSLQEQRKARREALEKLGLPQDQDETTLHLNRPTSSLRLKEPPSRATALTPATAPVQPAVPVQVSAAVLVSGKVPASSAAQGPSSVKVLSPAPAQGPTSRKASIPALAHASSQEKVSVPDQEAPPGMASAAKSTPVPIPKATNASGSLTPPKPDSGLPLQESSIPGLRQMNFKSKTLERSGVGLSDYLSAEKDLSPKTSSSLEKGSFLDKISPSILRNSRPRPASLGTGKDFAGIQVGKLADLEQERNSKRLSYAGQSRDKLPRPPCVSVKITPKGVPEEHRREALKKLGLLKE
ncbi:specifically androgen-regulated gene protein-like [Rhynchocyon petersi]